MCLKIHFFVGNPSWMAPCSDLICVNPIFYVIDKVKSYGKKFKRSEVRMTDSNQVKCADCEIYLYFTEFNCTNWGMCQSFANFICSK